MDMKDFLLLLISAIFLFLWVFFFPGQYFLFSILFIVLLLLLGIIVFERAAMGAKELALLSSLSALSIASRVLFFALPQVKPMAAIVFITGMHLGKVSGFIVGAVSMFLSNFMFGQSMNTPFQIVGMGVLGFIAGFFQEKKNRKEWEEVATEKERQTKKRLRALFLAFILFLSTFICYGLLVDLGSALYFLQFQQAGLMWNVFLAGVPFNLVHAISSAFFFLFFHKLLGGQISRVKEKYGLFISKMVK